tara:strand:+ start:4708 stop:5946 length:1239 start_codon:yes stop_codon:yes gene_type:complete
MSFKDLFLNNLTSETHLRDARHAQQIYNQNNFAFSPKTKHMYHVRFEFDPEIGNSATSNAFKFQKELSLLVKSADLPSFRASVENKQQYNRKKNVQTRVDYQDCRIGFHDDNTGVARALLEEYYRYYFVDGNKVLDSPTEIRAGSAFNPRDKYFGSVPVYGLNNDKRNPFFKYITIYQLSRREWFAYTLVNPLLTSWDHGSVQSEGSEFNENTISVAYEAVQYTTGSSTFETPAGFADASVGYDVTPSPLGYIDNTMNGDFDTSKGLLPALIGLGTSALLNKTFGRSNRKSKNILKEVGIGLIGGLVTSVLSQNKLPVPDSQNIQRASTATSNNSRVLSSNAIVTKLSDPAVSNSLMPALINSGAIANVGINEYNAASASQRSTYKKEVINKIQAGDQKLQQIASNALAGGT